MFGASGIDVVIAANCIHATRRLAESLGQCRRLLRADGLLVLNESIRVRDFSTLTHLEELRRYWLPEEK